MYTSARAGGNTLSGWEFPANALVKLLDASPVNALLVTSVAELLTVTTDELEELEFCTSVTPVPN